jgi:hypothetical protein
MVATVASFRVRYLLLPVNRNKEIERFANVRNNLVLSVLFNCPSESAGQLSNYSQKNHMTKYYSQKRPDNPGKPTEPDDPDKPVDPRPFDPDPSPGILSWIRQTSLCSKFTCICFVAVSMHSH